MHIKNDLPMNFDVDEPLYIDIELKEKPEILVPFIKYVLGLEMGSEEYNKHKNRWFDGVKMKSAYFRALGDLEDYWNKYKEAIKHCKLSGYDSVGFVIEKLIGNRQQFYYLGKDLDMEITEEEIENYKLSLKPKKVSKKNYCS
jgi:hypothetical protein